MNIEKIATQISQRLGKYKPRTGIILGTGLGNLGNSIKSPQIIPYNKIDGFPVSTVSGHKGQLIIGELEGKEVLCMQGRVHLYEGHPASSINTIISAFRQIGIEELIVTNAAGSLHKDMPAGSLMLIKDHINLNIPNPLIGPNNEKYGPRFPDMSDAYTSSIREKIKKIAKTQKIKLFEGTYMMMLGPCFETSAEIKALQVLGADAVGMSTVPEVICAVHSGMKVLGISVITNLGTGIQEQKQSHEETLAQAAQAAEKLNILIKTYIRNKDNG